MGYYFLYFLVFLLFFCKGSCDAQVSFHSFFYTKEYIATCDDYVHIKWEVCEAGTYGIYLNAPERKGSLSEVIVLIYADLSPNPTACNHHEVRNLVLAKISVSYSNLCWFLKTRMALAMIEIIIVKAKYC